MANLACIGFVGTNYNNVVNKGDLTRIPVLMGQCANAADQAIKCNNTVNNIVSSTLTSAKANKAFNGLAKTVNFVRRNINPFIVASSTAKVVLADKEDRKKTLLTEAGCLTGMFMGEGYMKRHLNKLIDKLPISAKWKPIAHGIIFVAGSLTASTIGQKIGKKIAQYWDTPLGKKERAEKEQAKLATQTQQKVYTPMNLKG